MMRFLLALVAVLTLAAPLSAQETGPVQALLQQHRAVILESSRRTIEPAIAALAGSGLEPVQGVLRAWEARELWLRKSDGLFYRGEGAGAKAQALFNVDTGAKVGEEPEAGLQQLKPNSGIRALLRAALVQFQLNDPDPNRRRAALQTLQRDGDASHLEPLRASIESESDPGIRALKERTEALLSIRYGENETRRIEALEALAGDTALEVRAALNPLLATRLKAAVTIPAGDNVARRLTPGSARLSADAAYALLADAGLAKPRVAPADRLAALGANVVEGRVGGIPVAQLNDPDARERAYAALAAEGKAPPTVTDGEFEAALEAHVFYEAYAEPSPAVTDAALSALKAINRNVGLMQTLDLALDALSLASIFFLAAIGLAITFG
ncbi:MAG: urea ABC transporter permease subunit UrtB, partial [Pseudooceanicola sp.]|nr:urea ABC transporter permease subunit UrtB [Pseudooceanicola sp.]